MVRVPYPYINDLPERAREELWRNFDSIDVTEGQPDPVRRYHYQLWVQDTVAASQTDAQLALYGITTAAGDRAFVPILRAGYITGIVVRMTNARTAGTLDAEATVNGVGSGLAARIDGTNPLVAQTVEPVATRATAQIFTGDELGVNITTSGAWAPTTEDVSVVVEVTEYAFGDFDGGLIINPSFTSDALHWDDAPWGTGAVTRFTSTSYDGASGQVSTFAWAELSGPTDGTSTYRFTAYVRPNTATMSPRITERATGSGCTATGSNFGLPAFGTIPSGVWTFITIDANAFLTPNCSGYWVAIFDQLGANPTFDIDRVRFVKL